MEYFCMMHAIILIGKYNFLILRQNYFSISIFRLKKKKKTRKCPICSSGGDIWAARA